MRLVPTLGAPRLHADVERGDETKQGDWRPLVFIKRIPFLLSIPFLGIAVNPISAVEPDPKGIEFFETKIRPVLVNQCYECHSTTAAKVRAGLLLDSKEGLLKG